MRPLPLLAAAIVASSGPLSAQEPRLQARLDPATAVRVEQLVDSAKKIGLPSEPLIQKALEGQSKGAAGDRIVVAVGALLDGLALARTNLGPGSVSEELVAGALWIRAGGGVPELAGFRRTAPKRILAVPIAISADLLARGWPAKQASETVRALLRTDVTDGDFLALRDRVDRAVRGGAKLDAAVRTEVARLTTSPGRKP